MTVEKRFNLRMGLETQEANKSLKEFENIALKVQKTIGRQDLSRIQKRDIIGGQLLKSGQYKSQTSARSAATKVLYAKDISAAKKFWNQMHTIATKSTRKTEGEIKQMNKNIREHFETGFSMHILQI